MAARKAPTQPLLVVLGSTGTGKSELAVELAKRFNGEVVNADAMQLYNGLPIITNKITTEEQCNIPHHLLGHVGLDQGPWNVDEFKSHASKTIREIRSRGNLPILVGGTNYYVDAILFDEVILDVDHDDESQSFPILDEPTDVILRKLKLVDPIMADRWHPNDRRKIQRSLEIYLKTGKPASELYAEQTERKAAAVAERAHGAGTWEKLLFWVHSERDVLCQRLDSRVDKMLDRGLLDEVGELYEFKSKQASTGSIVDMSKGIWQSIGYRQFEPYMAAVEEQKLPPELEATWAKALDDMKVATRRYANYQNRWIRIKLMARLKEQGAEAMNALYVLDSTSIAAFATNVINPAVTVTTQFLNGDSRPQPAEMSDAAREILDKATETVPSEKYCKRTCDVCGTTLMTEGEWTRHIKSTAHRRVLKRKKRTALVPVEMVTSQDDKHKSGESDAESGPEIASIFET